MIPFNERLEALIRALNLTPAQFGELHNVGRVSIHKMLQGDTKPGLETIERICLANPKISAEFLIRGEGYPLIVEEREDPRERNNTLSILFDVQSKINSILVDTVKEVNGERHQGYEVVR